LTFDACNENLVRPQYFIMVGKLKQKTNEEEKKVKEIGYANKTQKNKKVFDSLTTRNWSVPNLKYSTFLCQKY